MVAQRKREDIDPEFGTQPVSALSPEATIQVLSNGIWFETDGNNFLLSMEWPRLARPGLPQ